MRALPSTDSIPPRALSGRAPPELVQMRALPSTDPEASRVPSPRRHLTVMSQLSCCSQSLHHHAALVYSGIAEPAYLKIGPTKHRQAHLSWSRCGHWHSQILRPARSSRCANLQSPSMPSIALHCVELGVLRPSGLSPPHDDTEQAEPHLSWSRCERCHPQTPRPAGCRRCASP